MGLGCLCVAPIVLAKQCKPTRPTWRRICRGASKTNKTNSLHLKQKEMIYINMKIDVKKETL